MTQAVPRRTDAGFTLVEVVVALALLGIVATAALAFFVQGTRAITATGRTQSGVAVANDAMETALAFVPDTTTTAVTGLVVGRTQADVMAAWTAAQAEGVTLLADTFPAWDNSTSPSPVAGESDDRLPQQSTSTQGTVQYDVRTLVGFCFRSSSVSVSDAECSNAHGSAAGVPSVGYSLVVRIVVAVTWQDVTDACPGSGTCLYEVSSLVDPSADLEWNNTTRVVAADDTANVVAGQPITIDVLANDTLPQIANNAANNPVTIGTSPSSGTATVNASSGAVVYTAAADGHGPVSFTYRVSVASTTVAATITVYVQPTSPALTATAYTNGTSVSTPVLTSYGTVPSHVDIVQSPAAGTTSVSGTALVYSPPAANGTYVTKYTYVDSAGYTSTPGTLTVTVVTAAAPKAPNFTFTPTSPSQLFATATDTALAMATATGNGSGYTYEVRALPSQGTLSVDGAVATLGKVGATWTYKPAVAQAGTYTVLYRTIGPDGVRSADGVMTLQVWPSMVTPLPTTTTVARNASSGALALMSGGYGTSTVTASKPNSTQCNALTAVTSTFATDGKVTISRSNTKNLSGTCVVTFQVTPPSGFGATTNVPITVTLS